jgi:hypothetical protein
MIHIRGIWFGDREPRPRCDTAALQNARETVRRQLLDDKLERAISQQLVDRHNERVRRNRIYRQTGEVANDIA